MKSIKNAGKKLSLSKLNKTNRNYDVKSLGRSCTCHEASARYAVDRARNY